MAQRDCGRPRLQEEEEDGDREQCQHARNPQCLVSNCRGGNELHEQAHDNSTNNTEQELSKFQQRRPISLRGCSADPVDQCNGHWCTGDQEGANVLPAHSKNCPASLKRRWQYSEDDGDEQHDGDEFMIRESTRRCTEAQLACDSIAQRECQVRSERSESISRRRHSLPSIGRKGRRVPLWNLASATADPKTLVLVDLSRAAGLSRVMCAPARLLFLGAQRNGSGKISDDNSNRFSRSDRTETVVITGSMFGLQLAEIARIVALIGGEIIPTLAAFERELGEIRDTLAYSNDIDREPDSVCSALGGRIHATQRTLIESMQSEPCWKSMSRKRAWKQASQFAVGATASCLLLFSALADSPLRHWVENPSVVRTCELFIGLLIEFRATHSFLECSREHVIEDEIRRLRRGVAALGAPEFRGRLAGMSPSGVLRAEVAALRQAAWPPQCSVLHANLSYDAYDDAATDAGVRVGLAHVSTSTLRLESRHVVGSSAPSSATSIASGGSILSTCSTVSLPSSLEERDAFCSLDRMR